ncbi:MAG: hypothetical protein IPO25_17005 [Saprospiraceae bacterium]|nr:hypothetical protein [Saprospiraceae bacterium]
MIHQSIDGGKSWDEGTAIGTNPPKNQDKPWIASDPLNGDLVVTWTEFDKYASAVYRQIKGFGFQILLIRARPGHKPLRSATMKVTV